MGEVCWLQSKVGWMLVLLVFMTGKWGVCPAVLCCFWFGQVFVILVFWTRFHTMQKVRLCYVGLVVASSDCYWFLS